MATKTPAVTKTEMAGKTVLKRGERGKRGGTEGLRSLSLQAFGRVVAATCKARNVCPAHSETDFRNSLIEAGVRLRRCRHGPVPEAILTLRRLQDRSGLSAVSTLRSAAVSAKVKSRKPASVRSVSISEVA